MHDKCMAHEKCIRYFSTKIAQMTDQQKLMRLLKLITLLKCAHGRTIESLAEDLEVHARTIYRYLELLTEVGFEVETTLTGNRKFIPVYTEEENLVNFSIEESELLRDLIISGSDNEVLKSTILAKLYINSELGPISEDLINGRINLIKTKLAKAIAAEKQVVLKDYHSINGGEVKNYRVEPFDFSKNYRYLQAYDVNNGIVKQFKLERIGEVMILEAPVQYYEKHQSKKTDVFNFSGDAIYQVKLRLSFQAYLLLKEEYPKSKSYLSTTEQKEYLFCGPVNHLYGVGRFVMGMLDEIEIIEPLELKDYISQKLKDYMELRDNKEFQVIKESE